MWSSNDYHHEQIGRAASKLLPSDMGVQAGRVLSASRVCLRVLAAGI